jgi:hypothetical protein
MKLATGIDSICNDELPPEELATQEFSFDRTEFADALRRSMDMLAGTAMPGTCELLFPETYQVMWNLVTTAALRNRGFDRIYLGIPRGFCKTTFVRLLCIFIIEFTERNFILIVNKAGEQAENSVASVVGMLDEPNISTTLGNWRDGITRDTLDCKQFNYRGRKQVLAGVGIFGSIRGLNITDRRPDVMIYDDIQDWDNAESAVLSDQLITHFTGTVMKAGSKFRCLHIFIGNMYPFAHVLPNGGKSGSILRLLKQNPTWTGIIAGGILADGQSFWPELQSTEQLLEEYRNDESLGKGAIFLAEILNDDSAMAKSGVDTTLIPTVDDALFEEPHQGGFIIIDPSGRKKKSNATAMGAVVLYDGIPYLKELRAEVMTPKATIKNAIVMANTHGIGLICVEAVAYQDTLLFWFEEVLAELGIDGIELAELYPGGISKNARIIKMFTQLTPSPDTLVLGTATIMLGSAVRSLVLNQIQSFNPIKSDNTDDILDILSYIYKVIETYGDFIRALAPINMDDPGVSQVMTAAENSKF